MCWHVQIRALITGAVIGTIFSIIVHKLNLTTGIVPSLNIAAGLLGFIFLRSWTVLLKSCGITPHEFTPQACPLIPLLSLKCCMCLITSQPPALHAMKVFVENAWGVLLTFSLMTFMLLGKHLRHAA